MKDVERAENFRLTPEQRGAASMVLTGKDQFQGVQGLAGTGKTTMLEFVRTAAESKGWTVNGFSNGAEQAQKMEQESGIKSTTTAKHLSEHREGVNNADQARMVSLQGRISKTLHVMDEASQSGQREFNGVLKAAEQSGARVVVLGDKLQHQAVDAGKAFELAQKHMRTAELGRDSIVRQQTAAAKDVVGKVLDGKHDEAAKATPTIEIKTAQHAVANKWADKAQGGLKESERQAYRADMNAAAKADNQAVINRLAKDYAALSPKERQGTIIVTATNADRQRINTAIRAELKEKGELGKGQTIDTLHKTDRTVVEMRNASSYRQGDVVQFTSAFISLGVDKGDRGAVQKTDHRFGTVTLKMESGKEVTFRPDKVAGKEVQERGQREFAKGDRIVFTKNDHGAGIRNGERGSVEKMDDKTLTVKMDNGALRQVDTSKYQNLDHGYVSTSHAAQGQTAKQAWEHHNTDAGRHGDREKYVNVTRAQLGHRVYTQDADKAAKQSGQKLDKTSATQQDAGKDAGAKQGQQQDVVNPKADAQKDAGAARQQNQQQDAGTKQQGQQQDAGIKQGQGQDVTNSKSAGSDNGGDGSTSGGSDSGKGHDDDRGR